MSFYLSTLSLIPYQNPWLFTPLTPHFPSVNMYLWLGHKKKSLIKSKCIGGKNYVQKISSGKQIKSWKS